MIDFLSVLGFLHPFTLPPFVKSNPTGYSSVFHALIKGFIGLRLLERNKICAQVVNFPARKREA
jgi:hypothetical protein